ncbi:MAG: hypothetical protein JST92_08865, partial [Deltaproteobacteria bacterium]|nr:hypothetical protein [Deltaproteobacteria bacterium]
MSARKIVVACVLAASCTGAQRKESAPVEVVLPAQRLLLARRAADERPADALLQARAGWLIYLIESDPKAALERFSLAEAQKGATPEALQMARCGRGEILEDRLDATGAAKAWRDAVAADPKSPWAELAAMRLLDVEGDSEDVDEVVASAPALVANGGSPRAARFLREAAARVLRSSTAADAAVHERSAWAAMGAVGDWRVAGPLASLRLLPLTEATALDGAVTSTMPATGPAGTTGERTLRFPDGDVGLELEPGDGDLFFAQSELTVASGGAYLAWFEGAAAAEVRLDGEVVFSRSPWPREVPRAIVVPIDVTPGAHEVLVRWSRAEGSRFRMSFVRRDGLPGDIRSEAPAALSARRAPSPCALGTNCSRTPAWSDDEGLRGFAERALKADGDDAIASWLQVRSLLPDDRLRARFAIDRLVSLTSNGAAALALRASFALRDLELPDRLGRAAALADLRKATTIDPLLLRARLTAAALERDSERPDDAEAELKAAEQAIGPALPVRLLLARARLMEQQGNVAGQKQLATQAFALEPRRCDVRQMLFDIARREGGV